MRPMPTSAKSYSPNHSAPSGPVVMLVAKPQGGGVHWVRSGRSNSVITPAVVMRAILLGFSMNHSAPSGPVVMAAGLSME